VGWITADWFMAPRRWGFYLKSKSTNYPDHGHLGDPPPTRKIPMVETGIEPGTSWLVVRSSDHQTTRLVIHVRWNENLLYSYPLPFHTTADRIVARLAVHVQRNMAARSHNAYTSHSYPNSLITFHSKASLSWRFKVAGN
jgi:hypothetical protein